MFDLNPQVSNHPDSNPTFPRINPNHANYRHRFTGGGGVQFRLETMEEDSGVCSPPLWRSFSPPDSPNPRLLSPSSRAQAIARGQREIMEMVENMPETSYELSLKDIVEQRRDFGGGDETQSMEEGEERSILGGGQTESQRWNKNKKGGMNRQESNKKGRIIVKNGSMNQNKGLLINMFFPFSFGSKHKKSNFRGSSSFGNANNPKFSPKPELFDKSSNSGDGSGGGDRRDWWWKRFRGSTDSESLGITSSSSGGESTGRSGSSGSSGSSTSAGSGRSNSVRKSNGCGPGCWSFFPSRKRK